MATDDQEGSSGQQQEQQALSEAETPATERVFQQEEAQAGPPADEPFAAEAEPLTEAQPAPRPEPPTPLPPDGQAPAQLFHMPTPEERQKQLWVRVVSLNDFFRVLNAFGKADEKTREAIVEIGEAFTTLCESDAVDETALNRIQEEVAAVEDALLRIDESIPRDVFQRVLDEGRVPMEQLRRYARMMVSRPLPMGARVDRFDLLATRLLCVRTVSGYYRLLDRRAAKAVLRDLVGGLDNRTTGEEREQTLATISEASEKLPEFTSLEAFFESGYYLDVYGYKLSSRRQLVDPEILYNTVSLNASILNRLEELRGTRLGREELAARLLQQEGEVRAILEPVRAKKAQPRVARRQGRTAEKKKKKSRFSLDAVMKLFPVLARIDPERARIAGAVVLVLVAAVGLYASGAVGGGSSGEVARLGMKELKQLSPILLRGARVEEGGKTKLRAKVKAARWNEMKVPDRRQAAEALARNLKVQHFDEATVLVYETRQKAIEISGGVVIYIQGR